MSDCGITLGFRGTWIARLFAPALLLVSLTASAADDIRVETILSDLRGPAGMAIRQVPGAGGYEVYVAEPGAGRIVRVRSDKPNESEEAITGFIASTDDDDLIRIPGPHGLLFLDANRLVVAGSEGQGRPFVRLYELPGDNKPLTADQHEKQAETAGDDSADNHVANFRGMARTRANDKTPDLLVLNAISDDGAATIWKFPVRGGTLGDLSLFGKEEPVAAMAVTVEPRGHIVIIRPAGRNDASASRLEFVNPIDGRAVFGLPLKLANIVGAAYNPRTGNLYAVSNSSRDADRSGVYRIDLDESGDPSKPSATAAFVAEIDRPTALAFGPDGALFVTSLGENRTGGSLQRVAGAN